MQVSITGRHYEVTPALKEYVDARIDRFSRWATLLSAQVTLSAEKHRHIADMM